MTKKTIRTRTGYKNIYFNENTKKYDVKFNYREYNVQKKGNVYKSKWIYGIDTLAQAKVRLAALRIQGTQAKDKSLTLEGAFELWKMKALSQNFSPVTVENTANFMRVIYKFVPAGTQLRNIDEDVYYQFCSGIRAAGYSEETLFSLNATFRKIVNYAYKKRFLSENIFSYADNLKTKQKQKHRMVAKREFDLLDAYFMQKDRHYQLLFRLLYYTGIRIGEALAVTYADFETVGGPEQPGGPAAVSAAPPAKGRQAEQLLDDHMRIRIDKSYISRLKLEKDTKNHKNRAIPLSPVPAALYLQLRSEHLTAGGRMDEKIFHVTYQAVNTAVKRACERVGIPPVSCHDFRHTFISNLIRKNIPLSVIERVTGDTQEMILRRYSHAFANDDALILQAMQDL